MTNVQRPRIRSVRTQQLAALAEIAALSDEQRAYFDEAQRCGASHDDAMEAALSNGYSS